MTTTVGIINYGMGNLTSVVNAFHYLGYSASCINSSSEIEAYSHLVLPGVGAFAKAMHNLRRLELIEAIKLHVNRGKPFLGICLGMQLMASQGFEYGETEGLGLVAGDVVRLLRESGVRIPHTGWNSVEVKKKHPILKAFSQPIDFYFTHSFHFQAVEAEDILAETDYRGTFVSAVASGSAVGLQFHPEKSQDHGLEILAAFCQWDGRC